MFRSLVGRSAIAIAVIAGLCASAATTGFRSAAGPPSTQNGAVVSVRVLEGAILASALAAGHDAIPYNGWDKGVIVARPSVGAPSNRAVSILGSVFFAPFIDALCSRPSRGPPHQFSV